MSGTGFAEAALEQVEAGNGVTYAYRRVGTGSGVPLVLLQHFRGNIDNWDPALVDALAAERDVIAFDNTGVGSSSGTTPESVEQMAEDAVAFLDALGLGTVDLLGISLGGMVAQALVLAHPERVNRLVLAGTGPKGAPGMAGWTQDVIDAVVPDDAGLAGLLYSFYSRSEAGQGAGKAALGRIFGRQAGRDAFPGLQTRDAQYQAILRWGEEDWDAVRALTDISRPTFILQGDDDVMIPTRASHTMAGLIPDARIVIYPDASHGQIFQYPQQAAADILGFLAS